MKKLLLFITLLTSISLQAQLVYEPLYRDTYDYLSRLSQKGIIEFNDQIKPVSRKYIAKKFVELNKKRDELTNLEKDELRFFLKDFRLEINSFLNKKQKPANYNSPNWFKDKYGRYRLFSYSDELFKVNFDPILGYEFGSREGESITHRWNGVRFYGYLSNWLGFSFDFRDNREEGSNIDDTKKFTDETGIRISIRNKDAIEYSNVNTHVSANWKWGSIDIGKDFFRWGYGKSGLLVLSQKAPSFPFVRLDIKPTEWLNFNYIHGWLNSNIIDSNEVYQSLLENEDRIIYRGKYIASHTLTIEPYNNFQISLGESIIYSDEFRIAYLIPLMFFRLADHYYYENDFRGIGGSNSQFFFGLSSKNHIPNTHLYASLIIDELALTDIFESSRARNQFGFSLGTSVVDIPINNLTFTAEYTKIYPFVYKNKIQTQTYENNGYVLGHWMGNNSDLIYGSIQYRFLRGLQAEIWTQFVRKGGKGSAELQSSRPQPPFLFGEQTNHTYFGIDVKYEIIHELTAEASFLYRNISEEQEDGTFSDRNFNEFSVALYYGL